MYQDENYGENYIPEGRTGQQDIPLELPPRKGMEDEFFYRQEVPSSPGLGMARSAEEDTGMGYAGFPPLPDDYDPNSMDAYKLNKLGAPIDNPWTEQGSLNNMRGRYAKTTNNMEASAARMAAGQQPINPADGYRAQQIRDMEAYKNGQGSLPPASMNKQFNMEYLRRRDGYK